MQEERTQQKNREKSHEDHPVRVWLTTLLRLPKTSKTLNGSQPSVLVIVQSGSDLQLPSKPCDRSPDWLDPSKLDTILSGKLDEVVDALVLYDQTQKLEELNK